MLVLTSPAAPAVTPNLRQAKIEEKQTHTHTHEPEDRVGAAPRLNMDLEPPDRELSHCG